MENKKGGTTLLPEEVLKIIIAVVCIILLLILVGKIYSIFIAKTKVEQAKSTLDIIQGKIDYMKAQNINSLSFIINSPRDYYIYYLKKTKKLCLAPESAFTEHPFDNIKGILDGNNAVCKIMVDSLDVINKNYPTDEREKFVPIYQSTPVTIEKKSDGSFLLSFDTGNNAEFKRFLNSWKRRLEKIVIK
jgi:apolipoprotein N-acyltransferase